MLLDRKTAEEKKNLKRKRDEHECIENEPPQKKFRGSEKKVNENKETLPPEVVQYLMSENLINLNDIKRKMGPKPINNNTNNNNNSNHNEKPPKPPQVIPSQPEQGPVLQPQQVIPSKPEEAAKKKYKYVASEHVNGQQSNDDNDNK